MGILVDLKTGRVAGRDMSVLSPTNTPPPTLNYTVQSYDCPFTDTAHNAPTAMTTWGVFKPMDGPMSGLLIDCWAEHLTFPVLKPKVLDEWRVSYGEGKDAKRPDLPTRGGARPGADGIGTGCHGGDVCPQGRQGCRGRYFQAAPSK